jgi:hypothetical protein
MSQSGPSPDDSALAQVSWAALDGEDVDTMPLPRDIAEALARAFAVYWPKQRFSVKGVPWLVPGSDTDH